MTSKSGDHNARSCGHQGHKILNGRARSASQKKSKESSADQNDRELGAGTGKNRKENYRKACERDISFKPTSYGGCGGQKDLQIRKVADKFKLSLPKDGGAGA